jgi:hypothetical protein
VATDSCYFLIAQSPLDQPGNRFVAEIVKTEITDSCSLESIRTNLVNPVGPPIFVLSRLTVENQIYDFWPNWVCNGLSQYP